MTVLGRCLKALRAPRGPEVDMNVWRCDFGVDGLSNSTTFCSSSLFAASSCLIRSAMLSATIRDSFAWWRRRSFLEGVVVATACRYRKGISVKDDNVRNANLLHL